VHEINTYKATCDQETTAHRHNSWITMKNQPTWSAAMHWISNRLHSASPPKQCGSVARVIRIEMCLADGIVTYCCDDKPFQEQRT